MLKQPAAAKVYESESNVGKPIEKGDDVTIKPSN